MPLFPPIIIIRLFSFIEKRFYDSSYFFIPLFFIIGIENRDFTIVLLYDYLEHFPNHNLPNNAIDLLISARLLHNNNSLAHYVTQVFHSHFPFHKIISNSSEHAQKNCRNLSHWRSERWITPRNWSVKTSNNNTHSMRASLIALYSRSEILSSAVIIVHVCATIPSSNFFPSR